MSIISIIGVALLVIAAAAGVVGYFKANLSQATITLYKEDNEALRSRLATLEAQKVIDDARMLALENANKYLGSVVTQAEQVAAIRATVDRNSILIEKIAVKVGV